jgi:hypothetical protein
MKFLDNSPITDSARFPFKKGTLQFLQEANKELFSAMYIALLGSEWNPLQYHVLYGCVNSGSGSVYNISAGAIIIFDEIYLVDAASFTASMGQTAVVTLDVTQYTTDADPVTFTDATTHNVHNIRKMKIASGVSGSGLVDYSGLVPHDWSGEAEAIYRATGDALLQNQINEINQAWASRNIAGDLVVTGGSGTAVTYCRLKWKIVGKTMNLQVHARVTNTTAPTLFTLLIPNAAIYNAGFDYLAPCVINDGSDNINGTVVTTQGATTLTITPFTSISLTDTAPTEIYASLTFEIA